MVKVVTNEMDCDHLVTTMHRQAYHFTCCDAEKSLPNNIEIENEFMKLF